MCFFVQLSSVGGEQIRYGICKEEMEAGVVEIRR